jgi:hypothetical protein
MRALPGHNEKKPRPGERSRLQAREVALMKKPSKTTIYVESVITALYVAIAIYSWLFGDTFAAVMWTVGSVFMALAVRLSVQTYRLRMSTYETVSRWLS